jgi:hypothetical protein
MGLINDDEIPPRALEVVPVLAVTLQRIDRDDRPIVVAERVVVGRDLSANSLDTCRVQACERDGETCSELLLELPHHALGRHDQYTTGLATPQQLCRQDSRFERLAQAYRVSDQKTWSELL